MPAFPHPARAAPTRRDCLALLGAGLVPFAARAEAAEGASLRALAAQSGVIFGTEVAQELFDDQSYRELVLKQSGIITPGRCLKFDWLRPDQKTFAFAEGDRFLAFAKSNGLAMRGHNLIWNDWPPDWLTKAPPSKLAYILDQHIETVMSHYAGALQSWDVVNEPFTAWGSDPGSYRPGPWYTAMGPDYIFKAFQRAAATDPKTKLVLNEAWVDQSDVNGLAVRKSLLRLIDQMQDRGLKIDAVGLESHLDPAIAYDDGGFVDFLHALEARGVDIYLTEFDIDDTSYQGSFAERDRLSAERAYQYVKHALSVKAVKMVVCWGLSDRYTWWREPSTIEKFKMTRLARTLPYDDDLQPKPMREAFARAFLERQV